MCHLSSIRDDGRRLFLAVSYLVGEGKLDENDQVFQTFYKAVNHLINTTRTIKLGPLVRAIEDARRKGIDPAERKRMAEISRALEKRDPAVSTVVHAFYAVVVQILVENTWLLQIIQIGIVALVVRKFADVTRRLSYQSVLRRAYWYYIDYSNAAQSVA